MTSSPTPPRRPGAAAPANRPATWLPLTAMLLTSTLTLSAVGCDRGGAATAAQGDSRNHNPPANEGPPAQAAAAPSPQSRPTTQPLTWHRPRFDERADERRDLVRKYIAGSPGFGAAAVTDPAVLEAMRQVPRHLFCTQANQRLAYADQPLPIGYGQTISQPYIVALMTQLLEVKPGDKVLEIGTGSGYQAAVLSELTPYIYTIEIVEPLAKAVAKRFKRLGYNTIKTKLADGYFGWPQAAPFDAIIITCAATHVPPPLFEQLKIGGRMVVPLGSPFRTQYLVVVTKTRDGKEHRRTVLPVAFVPMTGRAEQR